MDPLGIAALAIAAIGTMVGGIAAYFQYKQYKAQQEEKAFTRTSTAQRK